MSALIPWEDDLIGMSQRLGPGLSKLLREMKLPAVHEVRQNFSRPLIEDVPGHIRRELSRPQVKATIKPGDRVAIAVGSRGLAQLPILVGTTVSVLREWGAEPFIVPAMGSHGGATGEGQREVLESYGVTEEAVGAPIVATMDTVHLGRAMDVDVFWSADAANADAVIAIARIKPHTGYRGPIESGVMKMLAIGLGKQHGAESLHAAGMGCFAELMPAAARLVMEKMPFAFGLGMVENPYDEPAFIEALLPDEIEEREQKLLIIARENMPYLPFQNIDVLVVQEIGKNISGSGMDPNITGAFFRENADTGSGPMVTCIVVLDLTPETHGNAVGIGSADITTLRLFQKSDLPSVYANCLTAAGAGGAKMPMIMENDRMALAAAIKACTGIPSSGPRLVVIRNTMEAAHLWCSENLVEEARAQDHLDVGEVARPLEFDADDHIISPITCRGK